MWLQADNATHDTSGNVTGWNDSSSNHNNAAPSSPAPTFLPAGIGTHALVHFNGSSSYLTIADSPSLGFGSSGQNAFVLEAVIQYLTPTSTPGAVFAKFGSSATGPLAMILGNSGDAGNGTELSAQVDTEVAAFAPWIVATGVMRIMVEWVPNATPPGGTLTARAGNSPATNVKPASATSIASSAQAIIGGADYGSGVVSSGLLFLGDIAELVLFSPAVVNPTDVVKLEAYLNKKYGL